MDKKIWELYWGQKKDTCLDLYKRKEFEWSVILEIKKYLKKGYYVLDLGCGEGRKTNYIAGMGIKVIGIDLSKTAVKKAKKNFRNITFFARDIINDKLPFKDHSFDAVTAISLLEYVKEKEEFLKEVSRVLKKDGLFIAVTPNSGSLTIRFGWGFLIPLLGIFKNKYKQSYYPFKRKDIVELAERLEFKIVKIGFLPITYLLLPKVFRPIFKKLGCLFKEEIVIVLKKV